MLRFVWLSCTRVRNMSVFTQSLNPIIGSVCWEEKDADYDYHQEFARTTFADMLHDHERNEKYYIALKSAIEKKHSLGQEANVLDIGTGTGLLSMMAANCGADTVTACEAFIPMANCARNIIKENGFEGKIRIIPKKSTELVVGKDKDMERRANILVTEVFDTELIGEGALSTFRHANEELLEKDSIVVPNSGTVWAQVVDGSMVRAWNRVQPIRDPDSGAVLVDAPSATKTCCGAAAVHDLQLTHLPQNSFIPLLPPQPIFRFDWSGNTPLSFNDSVSLQVQPIANGVAHAVFMWWDLDMDTDGQVLLSCAPVWEHPDVKEEIEKGVKYEELANKIPWRDHWMQAVYYLSSELPVTTDKEVTLVGSHDEYSFWFNLKNEPSIGNTDRERPVCDCSVHLAYSRTRIGQLNDRGRNEKYLRALRERITMNTVCLCLSDGCLLGLAAAKLGAKKVILLETNSFSRRVMEMYIAASDYSEKVQVIASTELLPPSEEIDLIFGEPNFIMSIMPWDNLQFWHLSSKYPSDITRIPMAATIKAVAVEFKDLHKIRAPLGICESFDMSTFDKLVQASSEISDSVVEAHPLWEYPGRALSKPFTLAHFELSTNLSQQNKIHASDVVSIASKGTCNGIAIWVDWTLHPGLEVTSGPCHDITPDSTIVWDPNTRQGVYLLRNISAVTEQSSISWSLDFSPQDGDIRFHFDVV